MIFQPAQFECLLRKPDRAVIEDMLAFTQWRSSITPSTTDSLIIHLIMLPAKPDLGDNEKTSHPTALIVS